jgi:pimeloyl-ACP methyl ester carboxylesterase
MPDKNLVFIHGFGSSETAWLKLINCIRDDPDLSEVRTLAFSYPSPRTLQLRILPTRVPGYSDIAQMLKSYLDATVQDGDVAIVTHSQGGLILQRFLAWMLNEGRGLELTRIRLIVMLACPNEGSEYLSPVRTVAGLRRHPQARELRPLNTEVIEVRRKVLSDIDKAEGASPHHCKIPIYAYAGGQDNVVTTGSAQDVFSHIGVLPGNHSSILDPDAQNNITFDTLKRLFQEHFLVPTETERAPAIRSGPDTQDNESRTALIRARPVLATGSPLIEETLNLTLTSEGIRSVRMNAGEPGDQVLLDIPSVREMDEYHRALAETAGLSAPPDDATVRRIHGLVLPLKKALIRAVPESARRGMDAESADRRKRLVAIELRLMNSELEAYPWELVADDTDVVVWRKVFSTGMPERWTSNLLLAGTADTREVFDEIAAITNELSGRQPLKVFAHPETPSNLSQLLPMCRPAALHLVSYSVGQSTESATGGEPGWRIQPQSVAHQLHQFGVWAAVFNCRYSAIASSPENRPPACEIAMRSGTATIGMAGEVNPAIGNLFAITFYLCLANGSSILQAYHEAVGGIRDHGIYSAMWSIPVMYASSPNVIPFPVSREAKVRLGFDQIRVHARALDRELQQLARGSYRSASEWASHAVVPIVRTQCIVRYLTDATAAGPAADEEERRRQERVNKAQQEVRSAMRATAASLKRLGSTADPGERREVLAELPLRRQQQRRTVGMLSKLIAETH